MRAKAAPAPPTEPAAHSSAAARGAPARAVTGQSTSCSGATRTPSPSAYTQSPGLTRTPASVTGTSASPGSRLELFSGYAASAFTPSGSVAMIAESRTQPLMMMPCAPAGSWLDRRVRATLKAAWAHGGGAGDHRQQHPLLVLGSS